MRARGIAGACALAGSIDRTAAAPDAVSNILRVILIIFEILIGNETHF
jgi:hypothetical protein